MASEPTSPSRESRQLVFVYGTLKRGHQRNHVLADQSFIGSATTTADYRMFDLGEYPGLVDVELGSGDQIQGEIYGVDPACLRQLDQIEAVDQGLYQRREIRFDPQLTKPDLLIKTLSVSIEAYFYLGNVNGCNSCGVCW